MKKLLSAIALLLALAAPVHAADTNFPTEIAIGPVLGLSGPGLAWRQYVLPWLGFQFGANSWGVTHAAGGAVLLSPYHDTYGQRIYLSAGTALVIPTLAGVGRAETFPAVGFGASRMINNRWMFFIDLSVFPLNIWRSTTITFIAPQLGVLYTF